MFTLFDTYQCKLKSRLSADGQLHLQLTQLNPQTEAPKVDASQTIHAKSGPLSTLSPTSGPIKPLLSTLTSNIKSPTNSLKDVRKQRFDQKKQPTKKKMVSTLRAKSVGQSIASPHHTMKFSIKDILQKYQFIVNVQQHAQENSRDLKKQRSKSLQTSTKGKIGGIVVNTSGSRNFRSGNNNPLVGKKAAHTREPSVKSIALKDEKTKRLFSP